MDPNGNIEPSPAVATDPVTAASPEALGSLKAPLAASESSRSSGPAPGSRRPGLPLDLRWAASKLSERALGLERAARLALELGDQAASLSRRGEVAAPALACDLYRQSATASLQALRLLPNKEAELSDESQNELREPRELASLLDQADPALLSAAAGSEERALALSQLLALSNFRSFAASEPGELATLAVELSNFARSLLNTLEARQWRIERPGVMRWVKVGALGLLLFAVVAALVFGPEKLEQNRDLAAGKPWRASSTYSGGCKSPDQDCPTGTDYFVHTQEEENPWLEFDLGQVRSVSGVRVTNRINCCQERAQPLVVSVSSDRRKWTEVVRNNERFTDWKQSFATVQARWVRFEIPKRTNLHLKRVRIFP